MENTPLRVGLLGYGYWGPNLLRNMWVAPDFDVVAIADTDPARLDEARIRYKTLRTYESADALLAGEVDLDLVVVATPPGTHFELGRRALDAGAHILMAKPLATNYDDASHLVEAAEREGKRLLVDHTYVYTGAVAELKTLIENGELGTPLYYSSVRVNLGLFQPDASVIWDLMPHDLSIIQALFHSPIQRVSATAHSVSGYAHWDIAHATVWLESSVVAFINVSWMAPTKLRTVLIGGSQRSAVYDDMEATEKVRIYDKGVSLNQTDEVSARRDLLVQYRLGDVRIPYLDPEEALVRELHHVARCIRDDEPALTGPTEGLEVVAAIEAMERSVHAGGLATDVRGRAVSRCGVGPPPSGKAPGGTGSATPRQTTD
jgi:predicted dehydrogenase